MASSVACLYDRVDRWSFLRLLAVALLYGRFVPQLSKRTDRLLGKKNASEARGYTEKSIRATYSDFSDRQLVEALHKEYLPRHPAYSYGFAKIDLKYRPLLQSADRELIFQKQLRWLVIALGVPALLYIVGFAIAWVREGFRR